jgi:hypothetical protein
LIKQIPLLIVLASFIVPMVLAGRPRPQRRVGQLYVAMGVLLLLWVFLCLTVYPRYVPPE